MSTAEEFAVEISGELNRDQVTAVVENLEPEATIQSLRLTVATDDPTDLTLLHNGEYEDDAAETAVRLQLDSDPFYIACGLVGEEEWLRSGEILEVLPDAWAVSEDALGTNLWSLADRGLIDKRPYEEDRRQKEYRITDRGERALEAALERVDDLEMATIEDDPAALPGRL